VLLYAINLRLLCEAARFLKGFDCRSWLLIDVIGKRRKAVIFCVVEESPLLEQERQILLSTNLYTLSITVRKFSLEMLTLSLRSLQISADPAFVTGITLINFAFRTSLVVVDVNRESMLTFHFVESQVKDCAVTIEPAQTNVHSDPAMYVLYLSSER